jgi:hypothetical protein
MDQQPPTPQNYPPNYPHYPQNPQQQPFTQYPPGQYPYQQPPLASPPPPVLPQRQKKPRQKPPRWAYIVTFILIGGVVACAIAGIISLATSGGGGSAPQAQQAQHTAAPTSKATTSTGSSSIKPTATARPQSAKALVATHGTPRLGGPLSDFVGSYGQPNSHSTPPTLYHFSTYASANIDAVVVMTDVYAPSLVSDVTAQAPSDTTWDISFGEAHCLAFAPLDSRLVERVPYGDNTGYDMVYKSAQLSHLFPAADFTDANGNTVAPGTFDISYLYGTDQDHISSCDLIIGSQQTNG